MRVRPALGAGVRITLFSLEAANQVASELKPLLERLTQTKREFDRIDREVEVHALASSGASQGNPDAVALERLQRRRDALGEELAKGVQAVRRRGCVLKDLDRGLLDFYALSGDRLIFLCWQLGEAEISHWHTLEGGFAGRRPLDRSELE